MSNTLQFQFNLKDVTHQHQLVDKLKYLLKAYDVRLGDSDGYRTNEEGFQWSSRFLGGYSHWHCSFDEEDQDLCDADELDRDIIYKVRQACDDFTDETGIEVYWSNAGEKAWSNFNFR